jgi:hypothetical protein
MYRQEHETDVAGVLILLDNGFTGEEVARLLVLGQAMRAAPSPLDRPLPGLEQRRLEFARWLVQHGKLSED